MNEKEKIMFLQTYLKNNTDGAKWFIPQTEGIESVRPTSLNSLTREVQNQIKAEVFVLFPLDRITSGKTNYTAAHEFIISNHFYYSSSFRDFFSAGGQWDYHGIRLPHSVHLLFILRDEITHILENANIEFQNFAYKKWGESEIDFDRKSFTEDYYKVIDHIGCKYFSQLLAEANIDRLSNILS